MVLIYPTHKYCICIQYRNVLAFVIYCFTAQAEDLEDTLPSARREFDSARGTMVRVPFSSTPAITVLSPTGHAMSPLATVHEQPQHSPVKPVSSHIITDPVVRLSRRPTVKVDIIPPTIPLIVEPATPGMCVL